MHQSAHSNISCQLAHTAEVQGEGLEEQSRGCEAAAQVVYVAEAVRKGTSGDFSALASLLPAQCAVAAQGTEVTVLEG